MRVSETGAGEPEDTTRSALPTPLKAWLAARAEVLEPKAANRSGKVRV